MNETFEQTEMENWNYESFISESAYNNLSPDAVNILESLEYYIDTYSNLGVFEEQCGILLESCSNLSVPEDYLIVAGAISVATNSAQYWEIESDEWLGHFQSFSRNNTPVNKKKLVKQDVKGAVRGGTIGAGGGLVGVLAGGLVGAGVRSAGYLVGVGFGWWQ